MKGGGGKAARTGAAAVALLVMLMLVAASLHADAAVARRLVGSHQAAEALSGSNPRGCTYDPNNPGKKCNGPGQQEAAAQSPPVVSVVGVALTGPNPNPCTHDPNDPTGKKCLSPPTAP